MNIPAKRRGDRALLHLGQPSGREYLWQTTPAQQTMFTLIIIYNAFHDISMYAPEN